MMKVVYNQGQILVFEVLEPTGARVDRMICNINDSKQGLQILKLLQDKYGFCQDVVFSVRDKKGKERIIEKAKGFLEV